MVLSGGSAVTYGASGIGQRTMNHMTRVLVLHMKVIDPKWEFAV